MTERLETSPIYLHDCPALGKDAYTPKALMADSNSEYVLYYHHKCPFCGYSAGEKEFATGVTETANGYAVDISIAEKLRGVQDDADQA